MKCMEPIQGLSKARRKLWGNPQNVISWAFMKQLREHNETRKVYACNPYIEVYQFRDNLYGLFNQNCDGAGDVWQWLIVGPEKCLLVDTAFGLGDMKALVDEISGGKEIIVVNTHDHFDHAFGNCRFGRAYCHESLVPLLEAQNEHMWDYLWDKKTGETIWLDFDKKDLPKFKPYEIIGVPDGYTWDLGKGYLVELINSNGHGGPGASMYLDHSNKILFPGDNICSDISGCGNVSYPIEECSLYKYRECVRRLVSRIDEIDAIFPMHFICDLESRMLEDVLECLNAILEDPEHNYDFVTETINPNDVNGPKRIRFSRYIKGFSIISYSITEKEEPPVPSAIRALSK
ncbi:MAG: MBL fold metallo-hydrolase [Clostridia bacterium]|nr:MBL fold metallo-hydrolase [Clostridia bacterium]